MSITKALIAAVLLLKMSWCIAETGDVDVLSYHTRLLPDMKAHTITGTTTIRLQALHAGVVDVRFPLNDLMIDAVTLAGKALTHRIENTQLVMPLAQSQAIQELTVSYQGKPKRGLRFGITYVYSAFDTCHWMICSEEPGDKAAFTLELEVPDSYQVVASGNAIATESLKDGSMLHKWAQERPYSPYVFGFAAGEMREAHIDAQGIELRLFAMDDTPEALQQKFQDSARMLEFFTEKAGVAPPQKVYSQVLVPGAEAQEASTLSFIGSNQLNAILSNPHEDWVIAHEFAHQWWGNLITCKSWTHFWLNEGITVFMTAAYKEQRWGRADYEREMSLVRNRYQNAVTAGFDVPLTYAGAYPSLQIKRASAQDLSPLFDEWVYGANQSTERSL